MVYVGRDAVAAVQGLEDLVVVDLSLIPVVDDDLEAQVGLLPDEAVALSPCLRVVAEGRDRWPLR